MAKLTDKENLLLSQFMYMNQSIKKQQMKHIIEHFELNLLINKEKLSSKELCELNLLNEIKKYPNLMNLKAVESFDGSLRTTCFVNTIDGESIVAIRGTGSRGEEWFDNSISQALADTDIQKQMSDFFNKVNKNYNIKYITGHSKGGNLAQYVTITCDNNIERCTSYDGQGFSTKFHSKYADKIEKNKHKIESYSSHLDYVNGIMFPVAPNPIFIGTKGSIFKAHSLYELLDDSLFRNSNFQHSKKVDQHLGLKVLFYFGKIANKMPHPINTFISKRLGVVFGYLMTANRKEYNLFLNEIREYAIQYRFAQIIGKSLSVTKDISVFFFKLINENIFSKIPIKELIKDPDLKELEIKALEPNAKYNTKSQYLKALFKYNHLQITELNKDIKRINNKLDNNDRKISEAQFHNNQINRNKKLIEKVESKLFLKNAFIRKNTDKIEAYKISKEYFNKNNIHSFIDYVGDIKKENNSLQEEKLEKLGQLENFKNENTMAEKLFKDLNRESMILFGKSKEINVKSKTSELKKEQDISRRQTLSR